MTFLTAPTTGIAFSPVSNEPLMTPLRRMVATTVATAIAVPMIGTDLRSRFESRIPPYRANRFDIAMACLAAKSVPNERLW